MSIPTYTPSAGLEKARAQARAVKARLDTARREADEARARVATLEQDRAAKIEAAVAAGARPDPVAIDKATTAIATARAAAERLDLEGDALARELEKAIAALVPLEQADVKAFEKIWDAAKDRARTAAAAAARAAEAAEGAYDRFGYFTRPFEPGEFGASLTEAGEAAARAEAAKVAATTKAREDAATARARDRADELIAEARSLLAEAARSSDADRRHWNPLHAARRLANVADILPGSPQAAEAAKLLAEKCPADWRELAAAAPQDGRLVIQGGA